MASKLKVTSWKVFSLTCICGTELPNPQNGSLNWQSDEVNGTHVICHDCGLVHKLPKGLSS